MTWRTSESYPCATESPARARAFCTNSLGQLLGDRPGSAAVIDAAELIVSELLTNAVNAHCVTTALTLSTRDHRLRIEVDDDAGGKPVRRQPDHVDQHGRGLMIVAALAAQWGVESSVLGKRVWADIAL